MVDASTWEGYERYELMVVVRREEARGQKQPLIMGRSFAAHEVVRLRAARNERGGNGVAKERKGTPATHSSSTQAPRPLCSISSIEPRVQPYAHSPLLPPPLPIPILSLSRCLIVCLFFGLECKFGLLLYVLAAHDMNGMQGPRH